MSPQLPTPKLEWLFVAFFKDGSTIEQGADDKPKEQPEGNAFTDVQAREDDLIAFELRHIDGDKVVTVDLINGSFMANGIPMELHNQNFDPTAIDVVKGEDGKVLLDDNDNPVIKRRYDLKLVYFREMKVDQTSLVTIQDDMSIKEEKVGQPNHYINRYFIGWETIVNKESKRVTLAVG